MCYILRGGRRTGGLQPMFRPSTLDPRLPQRSSLGGFSLRVSLSLVAALTVAGCLSLEAQKAAADAEVYALVADRRARLGSSAEPLVVEPPADAMAVRLRAQLVSEGQTELLVLDLVDCLRLASETNRAYQAMRESLYLTALDVTLERFLLGWRPFVDGGATISGDLGDNPQTLTGDFTPGFTRILGSGAQIVGNLGAGLFENLLSSEGGGLTTNFALSVTQPLLQGAGSLVTIESLRQSERNLVYSVRNFERFRRTLAFDVAELYYRILQVEENLANAQANADSLRAVTARNEALARAGRLRDIQVDQARQDEFNAVSSVINARQSLQGQVDNFALFLGLPVGTAIELDKSALDRLTATGLQEAELDEAGALAVALERRLDLRTARDQLVDARRQVEIAANGLQGFVGLTSNIGGVSDLAQPFDYTNDNINWSLGLDFDLPVARLPQRNLWRAALIGVQATARSTELLEDQVRTQIRNAVRELNARRQDYQIQDDAVRLSERRVESVQLFLEAGEAQTRDLLEAQEALVQAQNARVEALVDYRLGLLALWRDTELLAVADSGLSRLPEDTDRL